jgi:hypothetical protein
MSSGPTPTDRDFSVVASRIRHSYEVRVFNTILSFEATVISAASLARTAHDGTTVLTAGIGPDPPILGLGLGNMAVRWVASASQLDYTRERLPQRLQL